jgi:hypothetical protein
MTSSLGLKITSGLSSISSNITPLDSGMEGRRVANNSKSRARVLGYFDKSSVGANFHYLLRMSYEEGHTCIGFTNSVITVNG